MKDVTIVGATGAVGAELLAILAERGVEASSLRLFASPRSAGRRLQHRGGSIVVESAEGDSVHAAFEASDTVFLAASGDASRRLAPIAVAASCVVIDNSSAFRDDIACPLVVCGVNESVLDGFEGPGVIANPNCSTIIALAAIAPLRRLGGLVRMTVCTYQAISGAGAEAMEELESQARAWAADAPLPVTRLGRQGIFNVFSHDSEVDADGVNREERKLETETRRILAAPGLLVSSTCVRVPVLRAHTEAIHLEFDRPVDVDAARAILATAPGLEVVDDPERRRFPEPIHATGRDEVLVGRIRRDPGVPDDRGLALFAAGDQLRKGAALNAVQIADAIDARFEGHRRG